jgi:hypothetical protein
LNTVGANETREVLCRGMIPSIMEKLVNAPGDNIFTLENLRDITNESYS